MYSGLLQTRFGELPTKVRDVVKATADIEQLDMWLERFATAKTLKQIGIE